MDFKLISQYAGSDAHYKALNEILEDKGYKKFKALSAFVTLGGLVMIEKSLEKFLERGNEVSWIIGIDQAVTTKEALEFLRALQLKYPGKAQFKIFTAGTNQYIFHPKVFFFEGEREFIIITGSANSTEGGLLANFELSSKIKLQKDNDLGRAAYEEFERVWRQYSTPEEPLKEENFIDLCSTNGEVILSSFDDKERETSEKRSSTRLEHPLKGISKGSDIASKIKEKHGPRTGVRKNKSDKESHKHTKATAKTKAKATELLDGYNFLIMDILKETRGTQVQIPKKAKKLFFTDMDQIELHYREAGKVSFEAERPFIYLDNDTVRIELSAIKGKDRPLITKIALVPGSENVFVYEILSKGSQDHTDLDSLLETDGNRTRKDSRRWIIK